jgi:hypothetical protein
MTNAVDQLTGCFLDQRERFCQNMVKGMSQIDSYLDAGFGLESTRKIATQNASIMASHPAVKQRIAAIRADWQKRTEITRDALLAKQWRIADANPKDLFDGEWNIKRLDALTDDQAKLIESVTVEQKETGPKITVKLCSKQAALDAVAKMLGLDAPASDPNDKPTVSVNQMTAILEGARARANKKIPTG